MSAGQRSAAYRGGKHTNDQLTITHRLVAHWAIRCGLLLAALGGVAETVWAAELRFSLGVRETNSTGPIGANGGTTGDIEWVGRTALTGLDEKLVEADGQWHLVTFDFLNDPVTAFAGTTANGVLNTTTGFGVLESLRIANTADTAMRYRVLIDDVVNTVDGVATTIADFESNAVGSEVLFHEPSFSGSTAALLQSFPNLSRVTDQDAATGAHAYETNFQFKSDTPTGEGDTGSWLRLTTSSTQRITLPNPTIKLTGTTAATLSMQLKIEALPMGDGVQRVVNWGNSAGGAADTGANWLGGAVPDQDDTAVFNRSSAGYTVTTNTNLETRQLSIGDDDVTFDLGAHSWTVPLVNSVGLWLGSAAGDDARLTLASGKIQTGRTIIGNVSGSTGHLLVDGADARFDVVNGALFAGGLGTSTGTIEIRNGGVVTVSSGGEPTFYIAPQPETTGSVLVTDSGSLLSTVGLYVGERGAGELRVAAGGAVQTGSISIGHRTSVPSSQANGKLLVDAGGELLATNGIYIGGGVAAVGGQGEVHVAAGGKLRTGTALATTVAGGTIGDFSTNAKGLVSIRGEGAFWNQRGILVVGGMGQGELNIAEQGVVETSSAQVATVVGGSGKVRVAGANSAWNVATELAVGGTATASGGAGLVEAADAGRIQVTERLRLWPAGIVDVTGGGTVQVGTVQGSSTPVPPVAGAVRVLQGGALTGSGKVRGKLIVETGTVSPGVALGDLAVEGDFQQQSGGRLVVGVGAITGGTGSGYDRLLTSGDAALGGTLQVELVPPSGGQFVPQLGRSFEIVRAAGGVSGAFTNLTLPTLAADRQWRVAYGANGVRLNVVAANRGQGDFNGDGSVNGVDRLVWQATFGSKDYSFADANSDGQVDGADYTAWRDHQTGDEVPIVSLAQLRNVPNNTLTAIRATVHTTEDLINATTSRTFYLQDETGGTSIFGGNATIEGLLQGLQAGDEVVFTGVKNTFNGSTRIDPVAASRLVVVGSPGVPAPAVLQPEQFADQSADAEAHEGMLVKLAGVRFTTTGTFAGLTNYLVTDGAHEAQVRVTTTGLDLNGTAIPTGPVDLVGVLEQFDTTNPVGTAGGGYQLYLRSLSDITPRNDLLIGDFNHDGSVDAGDYLVWKNNFGSTTALDADGNADGVVDAADYSIWRNNFVAPPAAALGAGQLAVPEPATWGLALLGAAFMTRTRRRIKGPRTSR